MLVCCLSVSGIALNSLEAAYKFSGNLLQRMGLKQAASALIFGGGVRLNP